MATVAILGQTGDGLDIRVLPTLPSAVKNGCIVAITSGSSGKITLSADEPQGGNYTAPVEGDIWVVSYSGNGTKINVPIKAGNTTAELSLAAPHAIRKWSASLSFFEVLDAYLGVNGAWIQISKVVTILGVALMDTTATSPVLSRLYGAVGTNAVAGIGDVAQVSDFDNLPIYKDIKLCNLAADGTINAYFGDAAFKRDGTNGDVMVEIPKFWYRIIQISVTENWGIADGPKKDYAIHPMFLQSGVERDYAYVSAYEAVTGYFSKTATAPLYTLSPTAARTNCRAKGTGWGQLDLVTVMGINLLMYIEYATRDMTTAIGLGYSASGMVNKVTGNTDTMAGHTGRPTGTDGSVGIKWRHIENWWGNNASFIDGLICQSGVFYFCDKIAGYGAPLAAQSVTTVFTSSGITAPATGWIKTLSYVAGYPWLRLPATVGGSATTYYCDYYTHSAGSLYYAHFGGMGATTTQCGPACFTVVAGAETASSTNMGCRLVYYGESHLA